MIKYLKLIVPIAAFLFVGCAESKYTDSVTANISWEIRNDGIDWSQEIPRRLKARMGALVESLQMESTGSNTARLTFETKDTVSDALLSSLLATPGNLAFYEARNFEDMFPVFRHIMSLQDTTDVALNEQAKEFENLFQMSFDAQYSILGTVHVKDTATVMKMFKEKSVFSELRKLRFISRFHWSTIDPDTETVSLYALNIESDNMPRIHGDVVEKASYQNSRFADGQVVNIQFVERAIGKWELMTKKSSEERSAIAIVIDDKVLSAPMASSPIIGGKTEISGAFSLEEAQFFSALLNGGSLPAIEILEFNRFRTH